MRGGAVICPPCDTIYTQQSANIKIIPIRWVCARKNMLHTPGHLFISSDSTLHVPCTHLYDLEAISGVANHQPLARGHGHVPPVRAPPHQAGALLVEGAEVCAHNRVARYWQIDSSVL